jgi:hypothetical protein
LGVSFDDAYDSSAGFIPLMSVTGKTLQQLAAFGLHADNFLLADGNKLQVCEVVRTVPGKRLVCRCVWDSKQVYAKIFVVVLPIALLVILNFLYYSQPWEINANVQEAFSKISRMSFDEFKKTNQWKIADEMENYSADELFKELVKTAEDKNPETVDYHIRNLHKFYLKQYKNYDEAYREAEDIKDKVYNTKNLLGLFKKFEKRINNAGKKLKRNYARLMSIDRND